MRAVAFVIRIGFGTGVMEAGAAYWELMTRAIKPTGHLGFELGRFELSRDLLPCYLLFKFKSERPCNVAETQALLEAHPGRRAPSHR